MAFTNRNRQAEPQPDYEWEQLSSSYLPEDSGWGIKGWVLAAIIVSGAFHLALLGYASKVDWSTMLSSPAARENRPVLDRVAVSADLLKKGEIIQDLKTPEERVDSDLADIDEDLSLLEAQEMVKDKEIKLTPEIDKAENFLAEEGAPRPAMAAADLIQALEAVEAGGVGRSLERDVASMKARMTATGRISDNQLMLEAGPEFGADYLESDLLSQFDEEPSGNGTGVEGFSDLDKLLAMTGGLPANLDPVLMPTDLLFGYNEVQVKEEARLSLMKLGLLIQKNPNSDFTIEGHSDSFGGAEYNQKLSQQRADAVKGWLVGSLRLDGSRIKTVGRGQTAYLVSAEGSIEEQALNRRVEIVIGKNRKNR